jgi:hypothetical protein
VLADLFQDLRVAWGPLQGRNNVLAYAQRYGDRPEWVLSSLMPGKRTSRTFFVQCRLCTANDLASAPPDPDTKIGSAASPQARGHEGRCVVAGTMDAAVSDAVAKIADGLALASGGPPLDLILRLNLDLFGSLRSYLDEGHERCSIRLKHPLMAKSKAGQEGSPRKGARHNRGADKSCADFEAITAMSTKAKEPVAAAQRMRRLRA